MLKIIIVTIVSILIILILYEPLSIFISKIIVQKYEEEYQLLDDKSIISSQHYKLENISGSYDDHNPYYVGDTDVPFFTMINGKNENKVAYLKGTEDINTKNDSNSIEKFNNNPEKFIEIDVYPQDMSAYNYKGKTNNQPINLVMYNKKKFEWPSPCPYIGIPICNGFSWYGDAYFEIPYEGEKLKFRLPTEHYLFDGYAGHVFKVSVNKQEVYINISATNNTSERYLGWYKIIKK